MKCSFSFPFSIKHLKNGVLQNEGTKSSACALQLNLPILMPFGAGPLFRPEISQELRMLSSVTLNCQVTKIVVNSGSRLSEL